MGLAEINQRKAAEKNAEPQRKDFIKKPLRLIFSSWRLCVDLAERKRGLAKRNQSKSAEKTSDRPTTRPYTPWSKKGPGVNHNRSVMLRRIIGALLFTLGVLVGLVFNAFATFASLEGAGFWGDPIIATQFYPGHETPARIARFTCPALLTLTEVGAVTASVRLTAAEPVEMETQIYVSSPMFPDYRAAAQKLSLVPGQTRQLSTQVSSQDQVFNHVILARAFLFPIPGLPTRTASCGILVVDWPYTSGRSLAALLLAASAGFSGLGAALLWLKLPPRSERGIRLVYGLILLAVLAVAGMLLNLAGWWLAGGLVLTLSLLLALSLVPEALGRL
jgi:hypothetical protein